LTPSGKYGLNHFTTEASDLGWKAGQWPAKIALRGCGNGMPLVQDDVTENGVIYRQDMGCVSVMVYND
jgi:hypothetical protein